MAKKKIPGVTFPRRETQRLGLLGAVPRNDPRVKKAAIKIAAEDLAKLLVLCQHYGIQESPIRFYQLALALAREVYPEPKKRGRKSKWTVLNQGLLVVEIERLKSPDDPTHGAEWACKVLAKREPWKSFLEAKESTSSSPNPGESLRKIYFSFRDDKWAELMRDAFRFHEYEGTIGGWDRRISDWVKK